MGAKVQDGTGKQAQRRKRALAVGALMERLVEPALAKKGAVLAQIIPHWGAICPLLARHSLPESVKGGVLTVSVSSDAVKQELLYMAPQVVEGINMLVGYAAVSKVKAMTRHAAGAKGRAVPTQPPATPAPLAGDKMQSLCKSVRDDDLRTALARLGARITSKPKGKD